MKNILLPTDLTVQSLKPVHNIVEDANGARVNVVVVHFITPPTSITDLLFINQNKPYRSIPANFTEALQMLRNKYQDDLTLEFDFVYCSTSRYFNNYVEGSQINKVYMLDNYQYKPTLLQSENPLNFLNKIKVELRKVELHAEAMSEYQNLSALLNSTEKAKAPVANRAGKTTISYS